MQIFSQKITIPGRDDSVIWTESYHQKPATFCKQQSLVYDVCEKNDYIVWGMTLSCLQTFLSKVS